MTRGLRWLMGVALTAVACTSASGTDLPAPAVSATPPPATASTATTTLTAAPTTTSPPSTAATTSPPATTATTSPPATTATTTTAAPQQAPWYLAWSSGTLRADFAPRLESISGVELVSIVDVGIAHLVGSRSGGTVVDSPPSGFVIPLEAMRIDIDSYLGFVPADVAAELRALGTDDVVLGAASAVFRGLGVGDTMTFEGGIDVTVGAVVADEHVGAAEVLVTSEGPGIIATPVPRYGLVQYRGDPAGLDRDIAAEFGYPVRVAAEGATPIFRHADAVLPQITIKEKFGEFAYRLDTGTRFEPDPIWVAAHIAVVDLPLLGRTRCHRAAAELVTDAMQRLIELGLQDAVDRSQFKGCWNPRFIADRRGISRHAWGAALDINFFNAPGAPGGPDDPRLVEVLASVGFTNGRSWLVPDPGHFEWYGDDPPL